ncbi:MAG: YtxH domain-containing protein [Ferruginibacter sp.]
MSAPKVITLLLLGVVGGLLIAPAKGSDTRRKLSKLVNDVSDSVQDVIDLFRDETNDLISDSQGEQNSIANH